MMVLIFTQEKVINGETYDVVYLKHYQPDSLNDERKNEAIEISEDELPSIDTTKDTPFFLIWNPEGEELYYMYGGGSH